MPKSHRRSSKKYESEESDSDSCDSLDTLSDDEKICDITNEDIAQAFALFDYRLTQICKKIGIDTTDDTPVKETGEDEELGESENLIDIDEDELTFPTVLQVPIPRDSETGNPKIPSSMRRFFPHVKKTN